MAGEDELVYLLSQPALVLPLFLLVLFRVSGLMISAPLFSSDVIPARMSAMFAVAISLVMFPSVSHRIPVDLELGSAVAGVFGELMIGLIIGTAINVMFMGVRLAGQVVGQQAGLALGGVYDPITNTQSTILGQMFFWIALIVFIIMGGHRELLRAVLDTFDVIPAMSFRCNDSILEMMTDLLTSSFALALRLAGPILIAMIMTSVVMGFLSRTMPQLNILSVGFAIRIFVALIMTMIVLSAGQGLFAGATVSWLEKIRVAFGLPV